MISIIDDALSKEESISLIDFYNNNKDKSTIFNSTHPLDITNLILTEYLVKNNLEKILSLLQKQYFNISIDWAQIVEWPVGSSQNLHFDTASSATVLTSITYLNDDVDGGNTFLEDGTVIGIKTGRTVAFDGMKYKHGVKKISSGTRFTIAIWYKTEKSYFITN